MNAGLFKTAQKLAERYVTDYPQDATGYFHLGELFRQRQDVPKGKKKRDKAVDYKVARSLDMGQSNSIRMPLLRRIKDGAGFWRSRKRPLKLRKVSNAILNLNPAPMTGSILKNS